MLRSPLAINLFESKKKSLVWVALMALLITGTSAINPADTARATDPTATPGITEVSPAAGPAGTDVVITGDDFFGTINTGLVVKFIESNGDETTATIASATATSITLDAPSDVSGTVDIKVTTAAGSVVVNDAYKYRTALVKPSLSGVTPSTVPLSGNRQVVITGRGFTEVESVEFDGVDAVSYRVESSSRIVAVAPAGSSSGTARIEVTNSEDTSTSALNLTYADACEIGNYADIRFAYRSSVITDAARTKLRAAVREMVRAECSAITVHRYSLKLTASSSASHRSYVTLQKARATAVGEVINKRLEILGSTATVRYAKLRGQASQAAQANWDAKVSYRKVVLAHRGSAAAMVTSSYPRAGEIDGGTVVTIKGANLDKVTAVKFGTTTATFSVIDDDEIEVITPAKSAGVVDITLTSPTRTVVWEDAFRFVGETDITRTSIQSSSIAGLVAITITGKNFYALDNFDDLEFGNVPAASFVVVSPTSITAVVPANEVGEADIQVSSAGGSADFEFTYRGAPKISGVTPGTAVVSAAPASLVTIAGENFEGSVKVEVDGDEADIDDINNAATEIEILAADFPTNSSAGEVDVEVSTTGGTAVLTDGFEYVVAP